MKSRIVICDDELLVRRLMEKQLERYCAERNLQAELCFYQSGGECLRAMQTEREKGIPCPDIFLLDIYMEGQNGIDIARALRDMGVNSHILFVTGGNEYAAEAFEVGAFYYLQKPVQYEKLSRLLDKAMESMERKRYVEIIADRESRRIYVSDIRWMETLNRKLCIYTEEGSYEAYLSLKELLAMLPDGQFHKISRFAAVALSRVRSVEGGNVRLTDGTKLGLGERYQAEFRRAYERYRELGRERQSESNTGK